VVTGSIALRDGLRRALDEVAADPGLAAVRGALLLERFAVLPDEAYDAVQALEDEARAQDYPELA
jgi:hypothetical protein